LENRKPIDENEEQLPENTNPIDEREETLPEDTGPIEKHFRRILLQLMKKR
jgi:hypothetical protein